MVSPASPLSAKGGNKTQLVETASLHSSVEHVQHPRDFSPFCFWKLESILDV
jgi:hypothetical protein